MSDISPLMPSFFMHIERDRLREFHPVASEEDTQWLQSIKRIDASSALEMSAAEYASMMSTAALPHPPLVSVKLERETDYSISHRPEEGRLNDDGTHDTGVHPATRIHVAYSDIQVPDISSHPSGNALFITEDDIGLFKEWRMNRKW
jgi:hypothetical protein